MTTAVSVIMTLAAGPATTTDLAAALDSTTNVLEDLLGQIYAAGAISQIGETWYLACPVPEAISRLITRATHPSP